WPSFRMNTSAAWPIIASCSGLCFHLNCGARVLSKRREGSKLRSHQSSHCLWHKEVCMKTKILFSLILVISACGSIAAQNPSTQERPRRALTTETGPPDADAALKED